MPAVTSSAVDDGENPEGLFLRRGRPHMSSPGQAGPRRCGVAAADSQFCSRWERRGGGQFGPWSTRIHSVVKARPGNLSSVNKVTMIALKKKQGDHDWREKLGTVVHTPSTKILQI